jgi:DNA-binding MarR family transcriptional regulator
MRAADWFNDALLARLQGDGWPRLNRSQALVLAELDGAGSHPAELARQLGMTRQSMQQLVGTLDAFGLVCMTPREDDRRSKVVTLTPDGHEAVAAVRRHGKALERELGRRIGREHVDALRLALGSEWGRTPDGDA